MSEAPHLPEIHPESVRHTFGRAVAFLIAATAFLSGVAGYLYTPASTKASEEALKALRYGSERLEVAAQQREKGYSSLEKLAAAQEFRTRAWTARQRKASPTSIERWEKLASQLEASSGIHPEDGPESDPEFPTRYLVVRTGSLRERAELWAKQDAANELSLMWYGNSRLHLAALTTFAVALYLFGQSLTMGRTLAAFLLATYGAVLLLLGSGIVLHTVLTPPQEADDTAAREYARAQEAIALARYPEAIEHLDKAIAARKTFAEAYVSRGLAVHRGSRPEGELYIGVPMGAKELGQILSDLQSAYRAASPLGLETPGLLRTLAFHTYLRGLQKGEQSTLDESIRLTRRAIALQDADPNAHYNLGLALLAARRSEESREAFETGSRKTGGTRMSFVLETLTDLENLLSYRSDLQDEIEARKQWLVAATWPTPAQISPPHESAAPAKVSEVQFRLYPNQVAWRARLQNIDPEHDPLVVVWYTSNVAGPDRNGWRAVTAASGRVRSLDGSTTDWMPLSVPGCLPSGKYRAEFYLRGRRIGGQADDQEHDLAGLTPAAFRDLNIGVCHPGSWRRVDRSTPGVARGYISADETRGVFLFRFPHSPQWRGLAADALQEALGYLRQQGFPAAQVALAKPEVSRTLQDVAFEGFWAQYAYPGGTVWAWAEVRPKTRPVVILGFGPSSYMHGNEARRILESVATDWALE